MEKEQEIKVRVYNFIKSNLLNFIVIATSLIYILYGTVINASIGFQANRDIPRLCIGIVIAFIIKQSLGEIGFNKGYSSEIWGISFDKYNKSCNLANKYIDRVDEFYKEQIKIKTRDYRQQNLNNARLKYGEFFDEMGNYIGKSIKLLKSPKKCQKQGVRVLDREQLKILQKCIKVKIHTLNLFSEYGVEIENDTRKEKTDKDQRTYMMSRNSIAILTMSIPALYLNVMIGNWNWGMFIVATIQVLSWIACGITELYANYNYVVIEKTNKLTRKMELIVKFVRGCEMGLYISDEQREAMKENGNEKVLDEICDIHNN